MKYSNPTGLSSPSYIILWKHFKKEQEKKLLVDIIKNIHLGNFHRLLGRPASKTNFAYVFLDTDRSDVEDTNPVPPTTRDEEHGGTKR